jgi:LysM repeat protein
MKRACFVIVSAMLISSVLGFAQGSFHIVKKGETLSQIAHENHSGRVYGAKGSLEKILALNPHIDKPELIFPGQKILIQEADVSPRALASVDEEKKVVPSEVPPPLKAEAVSEKNPVSRLSLDAGFGYFRIDSKDKSTGASSTFLSAMNPEARLTWDLDWNEKWTSRVRFNYAGSDVFNDTSTNAPVLKGASKSRYGFEVGVTRSWSPSSRTGFYLNIQERIFTHATETTSVTVDRVSEPSVKIAHESELFHVKTATLGLGVSGEAILPGRGPGYSTDTGFGADAVFFLRHDLDRFSIQGSVAYGMVRQDSDLVEQSESHLGAALGLVWRLGE